MKKENKCETFLDHTPVWAGDGYFCSKCMLEFVPKKSKRNEPPILRERSISEKHPSAVLRDLI